MAVQLYLGSIPRESAARCLLRERALALAALFDQARMPDPILGLLHLPLAAADDVQPVDLVLLTPAAAMVATIHTHTGPVDMLADGRWMVQGRLFELHGGTPLAHVAAQRDQVMRLLQQAGLLYEQIIGALVVAPILDPRSNILLDIDDHRRRLKVCGFDEIAGLISMLDGRGAQFSRVALETTLVEHLGASLWYERGQLIFELAPARCRLRVVADGGEEVAIMPLYEGATVIGRRRTPQYYERRVVVSGDDLISSDHATIICDDAGIRIRDTSKNGTWILGMAGEQEALHDTEREITIGATLRVGRTHMHLEY
ncbi:MAG TPA: FHA domain-containing protein [Roseiflexaceae bacterium]|nr:FHA domain-containing protein [Roseiflexaceae bacterium]